MPGSRLRINTVVDLSAVSPGKTALRDRNADSGLTLQHSYPNGRGRPRRASTASTSSSISVTTPTSSSTNGSHSSIRFMNDQTSSISSYYAGMSSPQSPLSPLLDETIRQTSEFVLAMHDFCPEQENITCLPFRAGQVIRVLNRDVSGWWDGELESRRGWFPSNYVNADVDVTSLIEEELPQTSRRRRRVHARDSSASSATSWTDTVPDQAFTASRLKQRRASVYDLLGPDLESYCPPLMIPLLQALSLLQAAARADHLSQFQPSTACMISCVRSILAAVECLPPDASLLRRFALLSQERKRILSMLASLVAQAKKASEDLPEVEKEHRRIEMDRMLRFGSQVFAHVRRFLAVAVQFGVKLPEERQDLRSSIDSTLTEALRTMESLTPDDEVDNTTLLESDILAESWSLRDFETPKRPGSAFRARSMVDLRQRQNSDMSDEPDTLRPERAAPATMKERTAGNRQPLPSFSSSSSSSSRSSLESADTPPTPFPSGPVTSTQVLQALRHTHDHYLSTIAAFIGHAHSHSRSSHASSTGQMYDLVREIVDMVCKLLTIVEAVMKHPDVPKGKVDDLRSAKESLYDVTSSLAESVRILTASDSSSLASEEEERATLLRSATDALKAGADCVAAVKICLGSATGELSFVIDLPEVSQGVPEPIEQHKLAPAPMWRMSVVSELSIPHGPDSPSEEVPMLQRAPQPHPYPAHVEINGTTRKSLEVSSNGRLPKLPELLVQPPLRIESLIDDTVTPPRTSLSREHKAVEGVRRSSQESSAAETLNKRLSLTPAEPLPEPPTDPALWSLSHSFSPSDAAFNNEGVLVGATIEVLVEKMTPHDSIVDATFSSIFFLTFRMFSSPSELVEALKARYNIFPPPNASPEGRKLWHQRKGIPIKLRVSNFIKMWLELYWRPVIDCVVLDSLLAFTRASLSVMFPAPSQRIVELIQARSGAPETPIGPKGDRIKDGVLSMNPLPLPASELPRLTMNKALLSTLRSKNFSAISIMDFDALELARQITIMECNLFCAIPPEEVLESGQKGAQPPVHVRAVSTLSTTFTGWVAESILDEPDLKKRQNLIKFFIKVADRCTSLHNFSTPRSILAALDSSTISRLHQTWAGLSQKYKLQLEAMRRLADHSRNFYEYRSRLRNTPPPAVPFLGLYLTDVTFCREGNPSHRSSPLAPEKKLINFSKYQKLARIVQDLQRFQRPYNLREIPEVQEYLNAAFENAKHHGDLQDLYRRSLLVEPRQPADGLPNGGDTRQLFNWITRSQPQAIAS